MASMTVPTAPRFAPVPAPVLALVRHGETDWNKQRRIQGRTDIPLNDTGRQQAASTGELLAHPESGPWGAVYASPLGRAIETAAIIAEQVGIAAPLIEDGLWERSFGEAEGMTAAEIEERWPDRHGIPGAETLEELAVRAACAIESLYLEHEESHSGGAIVVAHGAMLRAGIERLTGQSVPRVLNGQVWLVTRTATGFAATSVEASETFGAVEPAEAAAVLQH